MTRSPVCSKPTHAIAGADRVGAGGADGIQQNFVKVAAMHHPVRRAEPLDRGFAKVERRPALSGCPEPDFLAGGGADDPSHRRFQAERDQDTRAIGAELHAGPDLPQFGRLLEHAHMVAALDQRQRRGQTAQAGAGDQDISHCFPRFRFQARRLPRPTARRLTVPSRASTAATRSSTGARESSRSTGAGWSASQASCVTRPRRSDPAVS